MRTATREIPNFEFFSPILETHFIVQEVGSAIVVLSIFQIGYNSAQWYMLGCELMKPRTFWNCDQALLHLHHGLPFRIKFRTWLRTMTNLKVKLNAFQFCGCVMFLNFSDILEQKKNTIKCPVFGISVMFGIGDKTILISYTESWKKNLSKLFLNRVVMQKSSDNACH